MDQKLDNRLTEMPIATDTERQKLLKIQLCRDKLRAEPQRPFLIEKTASIWRRIELERMYWQKPENPSIIERVGWGGQLGIGGEKTVK